MQRRPVLSDRSQLGGIVVSLMMQQLNQKHPDDYLIAMRVLWAPIGAMIFFWVIVPESPWYHARRGNRDAAMRSLRRLYGNIADYDFEEEYGIITHTIEHENAMLGNRASYRDLFKGVNTVSSPVSCRSEPPADHYSDGLVLS